MAVLAKSTPADVKKAWEGLDRLTNFKHLKKPEVGLVMVQARAGKDGTRFNLGEMTITRCTVQVEGGYIGCAYVAGRSPGHAEAAAVLDAMLQDPRYREHIMKEIIVPLGAILEEKRARDAAKSESTRVEFFTMVRGD
jgi:alpha-D-ribose 1-methylphosphonate 5-triphosphate synthase subunit PhnG